MLIVAAELDIVTVGPSRWGWLVRDNGDVHMFSCMSLAYLLRSVGVYSILSAGD